MNDVTTETSASAQGAETAEARVAELTEALVAARRELETLRVAHADLRRTHDEMRSSAAFRLVERIWGLRNAVGAVGRRVRGVGR